MARVLRFGEGINAALTRDGKLVARMANGVPSAVADGIAGLSSMALFRGHLTRDQMAHVAAQLQHRLTIYGDKQVPRENWPKLNYVLDMKIDRVPAKPIVKMMRAEHAESFLQTGTLRLGSIAHFRHYDHAEIGDATEGETIMFGLSNRGTMMRQVIGGMNEWIFCCFAGDASPDVIQKFGYDAAVLIKNPKAFSDAVSRELGGPESHFARCVYSDGRVLVGPTKEDIPEEDDDSDIVLDSDFADMIGPGRAFVKPEKYAHQKEFRFTWTNNTGVSGYRDIVSVEAASYCELIGV